MSNVEVDSRFFDVMEDMYEIMCGEGHKGGGRFHALAARAAEERADERGCILEYLEHMFGDNYRVQQAIAGIREGEHLK